MIGVFACTEGRPHPGKQARSPWPRPWPASWAWPSTRPGCWGRTSDGSARETLIKAAQVLTSDLHFESVIPRLVQEVVSLIGADAADCWILEPDRKLLRCRAVVGVPEWNVGRQIPPEGTIGRALRSGRTMLTHDFGRTEQPAPSPPYAVFSDVMGAPIMWLGEVRGVLGVCDREPGRFEPATSR